MKKWVQVRIARPTDKYEEVISFYETGLELKRIGSFENHEGYNGIMFGLPDAEYHLEFTRHVNGSPCPAPTKDNLLVFYMPDINEIQKITARLQSMGYYPVEPENPYWKEKGITIEDPDGWRIVFMNAAE
ncbi:VOC family protein [Brevibacillus laterosporus]|uniref:VOC family protein n=1 Tax=Brevibacillus laterosporus TaxID=1465 RepID=UPI00264B51EA|nr:VOC family protein [Brevibacillus laterosporus]MDN9009589.1 VOC family protein [Brevibacillus laterosporus]MDO0940412.1 VOC family protein [Brevibacillus laterosporus]